tara:strand:+ start:19856 stop:21607 length:1752 start_codon:yes stop_codon:yes gene_type:complete
MSVILGINAYHGDASACILVDGVLVAAAEEERFNRIKHWAGFPSQSIEYCLSEAKISLSEVDHITVNSDPKANVWKKMGHILRHRISLDLLKDRFMNAKARKSITESFHEHFPEEIFSGKVHYIEHHLAHLSSAFLVSPFQESALVSVDGFGDFASGCFGIGKNNKIIINRKIFYPHSLGSFYQAITQFIGFPHYGDEYKVMGLAPYGKPKYLDKMKKIVLLNNDGTYELNLDYFKFHKQKVEYEWNNTSPHVGELFSDSLVDFLGPKRNKEDELTQFHKDIAASAQLMFEEALFHLLNYIHDEYKLDSLCISGGCGNNSVANGKIRRNTNFRNIYVAASSGDAGGAIGSAFYLSHKENPRNISKTFMDHAYLGPSFSNEDIKNLLDENRDNLSEEEFTIQKIETVDLLTKKTAFSISEGKVIGWFQGRMEWGPRALGNRSILGDPRRDDMKEILNQKIKRRESFRPFAPSILREFVSDWFDEDDEVPFMMKVFQIKEGKRQEIPAVTHVDGSGRLQTVSKSTNSRYHALISAFNDLTNVPLVLNTSFNENEPIVCMPKEALECFLRTKMDVLVLNDFYIERI